MSLRAETDNLSQRVAWLEQQLASEREAREAWSLAAADEARKALTEKERAERAEKDRDTWRQACSQVEARAEKAERELADALDGGAKVVALHQAQVEVLIEQVERAEADNAAWLNVARNVQGLLTYHLERAEDDADNSAHEALGKVNVIVTADHPGAALLERLQTAEQELSALRAAVDVEPSGAERTHAALAAAGIPEDDEVSGVLGLEEHVGRALERLHKTAGYEAAWGNLCDMLGEPRDANLPDRIRALLEELRALRNVAEEVSAALGQDRIDTEAAESLASIVRAADALRGKA